MGRPRAPRRPGDPRHLGGQQGLVPEHHTTKPIPTSRVPGQGAKRVPGQVSVRAHPGRQLSDRTGARGGQKHNEPRGAGLQSHAGQK